MNLTDRISLLEICNNEFPDGTAVEIGMASGCFTRQLLATWKSIGIVHCIDAWAHQAENYTDPCNLDQATQDARYERVLLDFGSIPTVVIHRGFSTDIVQAFLPEIVDFIYLDANHSYNATKADLEAWWPALRTGGIFAGHDYRDGGENYNVKKAVDEFAASLNLPVHVTTQEYCRKEGVFGPCWEGTSFVMRKV